MVARARDGRLTIAVTDDGPGIPPEQLERVFERFHRAEERRTRDSGGTGLGLAIARAIVEAHGGRIWAESTPGSARRSASSCPATPSACRYRPAVSVRGSDPWLTSVSPASRRAP